MMKKLRLPATPFWLLLPPLLLVLISACSFDLDYDKYAVVVGVADYPSTYNDLTCTDDDARDMRDLLVAQGFQVTLLVTDDASVDPDEATYTNLQNAFGAVAASISKDDLFLFYFSGHGGYSAPAAPETTENASGSDRYDESIILVNDSLDAIYEYKDDDLAVDLKTIPCTKRIVIIDACYSGGLLGNRLEVDAIPPSLSEGDSNSVFEQLLYAISLYANFDDVTSDIAPSTALVIAAAGEREESYETSYYGHGVMTYFLLRSAQYADRNGDSYITVLEAYDYIRRSIQANWNLLLPGAAFSPHTSGGPVDYILFTR